MTRAFRHDNEAIIARALWSVHCIQSISATLESVACALLCAMHIQLAE